MIVCSTWPCGNVTGLIYTKRCSLLQVMLVYIRYLGFSADERWLALVFVGLGACNISILASVRTRPCFSVKSGVYAPFVLFACKGSV